MVSAEALLRQRPGSSFDPIEAKRGGQDRGEGLQTGGRGRWSDAILARGRPFAGLGWGGEGQRGRGKGGLLPLGILGVLALLLLLLLLLLLMEVVLLDRVPDEGMAGGGVGGFGLHLVGSGGGGGAKGWGAGAVGSIGAGRGVGLLRGEETSLEHHLTRPRSSSSSSSSSFLRQPGEERGRVGSPLSHSSSSVAAGD